MFNTHPLTKDKVAQNGRTAGNTNANDTPN
jgi:hypothetical protein